MRFARNAFAASTVALLGALFPALCQGQGAGDHWSTDKVQAAITGCRESILSHATKDFMARRNLTAAQLPPDFRERLTRAFQPLLLTCDCSITSLSKEMPFEKFAANAPDVQQRARELTARGGACEPKGMAPAPAGGS